jgi:hypothetical protein
MKKFILCWLILLFGITTNAQDTTGKKKIDYKTFDRIVFFGTNFSNSLFLYLDGPRVLFWVDKKRTSKVGLAFFPTMYYNFSTKTLDPKLGIGLRVDYKKLSFGVPFYQIDDKWKPHIGFGIKF